MTRRLTILAALALAASGLSACASGGGQESITEEQRGMSSMRIDVGGLSGAFDLRYVEDITPAVDTLDAPVARVWDALPGAYVELDIPLASVNPEARLLGNDGFRAQGRLGLERISQFIHCGRRMTGDIADRYEVYFTILSQVQEVQGTERTRIVTLVDATASPSSTSGNAVRCSSRGRLEQRVLERVRARVASGAGSG